MIKLLVEKSK